MCRENKCHTLVQSFWSRTLASMRGPVRISLTVTHTHTYQMDRCGRVGWRPRARTPRPSYLPPCRSCVRVLLCDAIPSAFLATGVLTDLVATLLSTFLQPVLRAYSVYSLPIFISGETLASGAPAEARAGRPRIVRLRPIYRPSFNHSHSILSLFILIFFEEAVNLFSRSSRLSRPSPLWLSRSCAAPNHRLLGCRPNHRTWQPPCHEHLLQAPLRQSPLRLGD